jgi:hypothetical protein
MCSKVTFSNDYFFFTKRKVEDLLFNFTFANRKQFFNNMQDFAICVLTMSVKIYGKQAEEISIRE